MLNQEIIQKIANENQTSKDVFSALRERVRFTRRTNMDKFESDLLGQGFKIESRQYFDIFKKLEDAGAGRIVFGRKGNPTRFTWNYDLKDVARASVTTIPDKEIKQLNQPLAKKRGRPRKVVSVPVVPQDKEKVSVTINVSKELLSALNDVIAKLQKVA